MTKICSKVHNIISTLRQKNLFSCNTCSFYFIPFDFLKKKRKAGKTWLLHDTGWYSFFLPQHKSNWHCQNKLFMKSNNDAIFIESRSRALNFFPFSSTSNAAREIKASEMFYTEEKEKMCCSKKRRFNLLLNGFERSEFSASSLKGSTLRKAFMSGKTLVIVSE